MNDSNPVVLLAEDDDDISALVRHRLERADLHVLVARTGAAAIALALEHRPDVMLVDVGLPDGDGFDVCRRVLEESEAPPAVIFLTARDATSDRVAGLDAGAVDYVAKPFEAAELLARVHAALRTKQRADDLARRATTDVLTGMLNRQSLAERAAEQVSLARRGRPFACAMLDIDHFKRLNDRYGHAAGDDVLREVARRMRVSVRGSDLVFRYGGEEFLVLLPDTSLSGAEATGRKLLEAICDAPAVSGIESIDVSVSVGVAVWRDAMHTSDELFAAADAALYRAKRLGRARLALAS